MAKRRPPTREEIERGERIERARTAREMTKAELRDAVSRIEGAKVEWHTIQRWLKGELGGGRSRIVTLARALRVRPEWLDRGEGPMDLLTLVERDDQPPPGSIERAIAFLGSRISKETASKALSVRWGDGAPDDGGAVEYLMGLEAKRAGRQLASEARAGDTETEQADAKRKKAGLKKVPPKKKKD